MSPSTASAREKEPQKPRDTEEIGTVHACAMYCDGMPCFSVCNSFKSLLESEFDPATEGSRRWEPKNVLFLTPGSISRAFGS